MNCVIDALSIFTNSSMLLCDVQWITSATLSVIERCWPLAQVASADLLSSSSAILGDAGQATLDAGHAAADHHDDAGHRHGIGRAKRILRRGRIRAGESATDCDYKNGT